MSNEYDHSFDTFPRPDVSELNARGVEFNRNRMEKECDEAIDLVFEGIMAHLEADRELHERLEEAGYPEGETTGNFVRKDTLLTAPAGESNKDLMFIHLEPEAPEVPVQRGKTVIPERHRHMNIYIPEGSGDIHQYRMPEKEEVNTIYIQTVDDGDVQWFCMARGGFLYKYIPPALQVDEKDGLVIPEESGNSVWNDYEGRLPESSTTIHAIFKQVVEWKTVPQVLRTIK